MRKHTAIRSRASFAARLIHRYITRDEGERVNPWSVLINITILAAGDTDRPQQLKHSFPVFRRARVIMSGETMSPISRVRGWSYDAVAIPNRCIVRGLPQRPANADSRWKAGYPARARTSKQMRKFDAGRPRPPEFSADTWSSARICERATLIFSQHRWWD